MSLVVAVMNGWGSSSKVKESKTSVIVRKIASKYVKDEDFIARRSMIGMGRHRLFRNFILNHQHRSKCLLLVGKSLGAKNLIEIANSLPRYLNYKKIAMITIDPCWPTISNLRPNLNHEKIRLNAFFDRVINIYAIRPENEQAGCMVQGPGVRNVHLSYVTHQTISSSRKVAMFIMATVLFLEDRNGISEEQGKL